MNARWVCQRAKTLFQEVVDRGHTLPLASVTKDGGVEFRSDLAIEVWNPGEDVSLYKRVQPGDFVIGLRSFQSGLGHSQLEGLVSPAYTVLRPKAPLEERFFKHYFKSGRFISQLGNVSQGIRQGRTIATADFYELRVPVPPLDQQREIADFLDAETARIDALVAKKRRMIELLEERKEACLDELLESVRTCQRRPMRSLGVGGLFVDGDWVELPHISDRGIRLLQTGNIGVGCFKEQGYRFISEESFEQLRCTEVFPADVLLCRLAAPVGRACQAPDLGTRMITAVDVCILRPGPDIDPAYVVSYCSGRRYLDEVQALARGGTRQRVSREQLGSIGIPVPSLVVQRKIAREAERLRDASHSLTSRILSQLDLLREHRQALITAAVTGEMEVLNAG